MEATTIETQRLCLVKITQEDFNELCEILQDIEIMYAWGHAFSNQQVSEWICENLKRYETDGFSYFKAIKKDTNQTIGVIGPLMETIKDERCFGVGYILNKKYWGCGYASEGAKACLDYSFSRLGADQVVATIRQENTSSQKVAQRLGMCISGQFIKHYHEKDMLHLIYSISKEEFYSQSNTAFSS